MFAPNVTGASSFYPLRNALQLVKNLQQILSSQVTEFNLIKNLFVYNRTREIRSLLIRFFLYSPVFTLHILLFFSFFFSSGRSY